MGGYEQPQEQANDQQDVANSQPKETDEAGPPQSASEVDNAGGEAPREEQHEVDTPPEGGRQDRVPFEGERAQLEERRQNKGSLEGEKEDLPQK